MCQLDIVKPTPGLKTIRNLQSRRDLAQNAAQLVKIDRLCQMEIEPSFSSTLDIVTRCKTRYRHGFHRSFSFRFHNDIVAIPVWQRDIAQHNVELFGFDHVQRTPCVISRGYIMTEVI